MAESEASGEDVGEVEGAAVGEVLDVLAAGDASDRDAVNRYRSLG